MIRTLLLILFTAMLGSRALGLDLGLGPGLSIKNALIYATATLIAIDSAIARNRDVELLSVIVPFASLIFYAVMTWIAIVVFLEYPYYMPGQTLIRLKTKLVDQFIVLLIFFYGVTNSRDALWLIKGLTWVVMSSCFITIIDTFNIPDLGIITARDMDGRIEGILGAAAEFGGLLAFFIPAMAALWWIEFGFKRFLALLGIGLALVCILISGSRGAMLGLVAGALVTGFFLRRYISMRIAIRTTAALLVFVVLAVLVVMSTEFGTMLEQRLSTGLDTGSLETISSGRTTIWLKAFREMADHPHSFITGLGWESYFQTIGHRYATHNVYLDRLYNLGMIGLVLYLLTFISAIWITRRGIERADDSTQPFLIATVTGLMAILFSMAFTDIESTTIYVWAFTGLALRIAVLGTVQNATEKEAQSIDSRLIRAKANAATRPMSNTPNW